MTGGLSVRGLTVTYPGSPPRVAVRDATFDLPAGGSLALVGPSGSGKSSLLLALAGVIDSYGEVRWGEERLDTQPVHRRGIGVVFQDGQLFPHLTVEQNVAFGLQMQRVPRALQAERVTELLELVGLPGTQERAVTQLSGGERQRIALARTLAPAPRVVLLDEPLSSLDAELRTRLATDIRGVLEAAGATWIVVTHDPAEAAVMADATATMRAGSPATPHRLGPRR